MRRCMTMPVLLVAPLVLLVRGAAGQPCAPFLTDEFRDGPGLLTNDMAVFDDGAGHGPRLYMGGGYPATGHPYRRILVWDGMIATSIDVIPGISGLLEALCTHDDGTGLALYAAGEFASEAGAPRDVARWDGSAWSPVGEGPGGAVNTLRSLNGALVAGGLFESEQGESSGVAAWDGGAWTLLGALGAAATQLATFDGALYAATVETINGNALWRWDGATWSMVGAPLEGIVNALVAWDDPTGEALYVAGEFERVGSLDVTNVARWDGAEWSAVGEGVAAPVTAMEAWDGTGTDCLWAAGGPIDPIARWDGAQWHVMPNPFIRDALCMAVFDDGHGPELITAGGRSGRLARVPDPAWLPLSNGIGGNCAGTYGPEVQTLTRAGTDDQLYLAGGIECVGRAAGLIFEWDGAEWQSLGAPDELTDCYVGALLEHDDGQGPALYAAAGNGAALLARGVGDTWETIASGQGLPAALATFDDGRGSSPALYVGGGLTSFGGVAIENLARWDGAAWTSPGAITGENAMVYSMLVFDDGAGPALFVGGRFNAVDGAPAGQIARWDGASWSMLDGGVDGNDPFVYSMKAYDDGRGPALYAAGRFSTAGGVAVSGLARWDGVRWESCGDDPSYGGPMEVFNAGDGERLYVANNDGVRRWDGRQWTFWQFEGAAELSTDGTRNLVALDGADGPSLFLSSHFSGLNRIRACALTDVGDLNNDGAIDMLDLDELFAAWGPCSPPCAADVYADGVVDALDLLTLLAHWTG